VLGFHNCYVVVCVERASRTVLIQLMASIILLSLCAVIQLTSSQYTYDIDQHDYDVTGCCSCGYTEKMFDQLMKSVLLLREDVSQLKADMSRRNDVTGTR